MARDAFVLLFVLGCAALAIWVAACRPRLAPTRLRSAALHLAAAFVVGTVLGPALNAVPGLPSFTSILVAVFAVGLPAITYMLLVGLWLVQLAVGEASLGRR